MSHVVVLAGGLSAEREVSLRSGRRVAAALQLAGTETRVLDVDADLLATLAADPPRAVVPLLHGAAGEDGALREVLDTLGLPYVGAGAAACRLAFDKAVAKTLLAAAGVRTPESVTLAHETFRQLGADAVLAAVVRRLGLPLMVRPTQGGSSLGASVVSAQAELPGAMVAAFAYGHSLLIERFVTGTEVAVGVLDGDDGPRSLPVVEIRPDSGRYDYAARYTAGATEFVVPAELAPEQLRGCAEVAVTAHRTLGLSHWSRSDLIVDPAGVPWFLEVNLAPGMTETSTYPLALAAAGLDLGEVAAALISAVAPELDDRTNAFSRGR
ncbi:MAG TPA: D-alanine--D-alanine ligase [Candidatus Nanopelagicales bacterium]|jgi:D-alanine-D-alanine ligase|nr:D-alanine--D-alanine ligase [Candidatus Nanopelagicales bacterium]